MRRETYTCARRELDLDNIDIGTDAWRGDGTAHITGLRVFPELLVTLFHQR
ncbi:hypothetical protein D3C72_2531610 [compost metagenome]